MREKRPTTIFDLPNCFIIEIIATLPMETVMICKCVCKNWYQILLDPTFPKLHLHRSPRTSAIALFNAHIPGGDIKACLYNSDVPPAERLYRNTTFPDPKFDRSVIFGHCNGLVLFGLRSGPELYVFNPIVRKKIKLPDTVFGDDGGLFCGFYGIGYSRVSDKYKVIKVTKSNTNGRKLAEICQLGDLMWWRKMENLPPGDFWWSRGGVFINGALYWFVTESSDYLNHVGSICRFDLDTEQFCLIPPPPPLEQFHVKDVDIWKKADGSWCLHCSRVHICFWRGCFLVWTSDGKQATSWAIRDNGVSVSWSKAGEISTSWIKFACSSLAQGLYLEPSFISPQDL